MQGKYRFFTAKELKPAGWLRRQLEIQRDGLSGNLDLMWPDIRDSAWIGGSREGWERVPYWLDGAVPLAWLLDDGSLKARVTAYIDAILERQQPDGWICPCSPEERASYDAWALLLICKVLVVYHDCTGDARIQDAVRRALKNYYDLLSSGACRLTDWAKARWFEGFLALNWLYERAPEPWMPKLALLLQEQGQDYPSVAGKWERPMNEWTMNTHVVNLAMMLKYEAVSCSLLNAPYTGRADELLRLLRKYNGTPVGSFTGDECLSGLSPIQGTELCAIVEEMYSCELLYAFTGKAFWAELLELLAFNALPATLSDDMWTHQYVQMSNQISCVRFPGRSLFRTNSSESHLFGLEPNFGCCTANFNQGWPKFALSSFLQGPQNTILCAVAVPSMLSTAVNGVPVTISVDTEYPFRNRMVYRITCREDVSMTFKLRVPSFAENLRVNGQPAKKNREGMLSFSGFQKGVLELTVEFDTVPVLKSRPHSLRNVQCGSLVFSLPVEAEWKKQEYEKDGVERKFPYCDYELAGKSPWNYGFSASGLRAQGLQVEYREGDAYPFSSAHPRVILRAPMVPVRWGWEDGFDTVCAKVPQSRRPAGPAETLELHPYGCSKLRMTEMPLVKDEPSRC